MAQFHSGDVRSDHFDNSTALQPCRALGTGDLFGNGNIDAAFLFGDRVRVLWHPAVHHAEFNVQVDGNDLAVYGRDGLADWMWIVGPDGLTRWSWDGASFQDDSRNTAGSLWNGALALGVANLDDLGELDLYGLDASRRLILLVRNADQAWETTTALPARAEDVLAIDSIQWDGSGPEEIVIRGESRLHVLDLLGTPLASHALGSSNALLGVADLPDGRQAALAFESGPSSATQWLRVFSQDGALQDLDLESREVAGIATADFNGSGAADAALTMADAPRVDLYLGTTASGVWNLEPDLTRPNVLPPNWTLGYSNDIPLLLEDLDEDGDADLLLAPTSANRADRFPNQKNDALAASARLTGVSMSVNRDGAVFAMTAELPALGGPWDDLEVTVWRQRRFDHHIDAQAHMPRAYYSAPNQKVTFDVQTEHGEFFQDLYLLELRAVDRSAGSVTRRSPTNTVAVSLVGPLARYLSLETLPPNWPGGPNFSVPSNFYPSGNPAITAAAGTANPRITHSFLDYPSHLGPSGNLPGLVQGGQSGPIPQLPDNPVDVIPVGN